MNGRETESTAIPSLHSNTSSPVRFLGFPKLPDPDQHQSQTNNPLELELELDESDVLWSFSSTDSSTSDVACPSSPPLSTSPSHLHLLHHHQTRLSPSKSGLSAALSDDNHHHLIRRKSTLNPSISATSATRIIPPVNSDSYSPNSIKLHQSAPVNVPAWPKKPGESNNIIKNGSHLDKFDEVEEDELEDEDEMVPPHVMVARSHVTFSVFEGVGRTLKGRDLRRLRNTVFQQTGFLE